MAFFVLILNCISPRPNFSMTENGNEHVPNERDKAPIVSDRQIFIFRVLGKLMNDVGVPGFVVIVLTIIILTFPSKEQKQELINTWFLFKGEYNIVVTIIIIIALVLLLFMQTTHCIRTIRLHKQRVQDCAKEKTHLQKLLVDKNLASSNSNNI